MPLKSSAQQVLVDPSVFAGPEPDPGLRLPGYAHPELAATEVDRLARVAKTLPPGKRCPSGHDNPAEAEFCMKCGKSIEPLPKWRCGHDNPAEAEFCMKCGGRAFALPVSGAGLAVELAARVDQLPGMGRPRPESMLSESENAERQRAHAAAVAAGKAMPKPRYVASSDPNQRVIHFVEDGLTWAGLVWYRGQEIRIGPDHPRWEQAQEWINLTEFEQVERYGGVKFRQGPWPGLGYADALRQQQRPMRTLDKKGELALPGEDDLRKAEEAEARRRGAVPALAV